MDIVSNDNSPLCHQPRPSSPRQSATHPDTSQGAQAPLSTRALLTQHGAGVQAPSTKATRLSLCAASPGHRHHSSQRRILTPRKEPRLPQYPCITHLAWGWCPGALHQGNSAFSLSLLPGTGRQNTSFQNVASQVHDQVAGPRSMDTHPSLVNNVEFFQHTCTM